MTIPHIFTFTIAYADTDAGGVVYHARYVEIAERARMKWQQNFILPDGDLGFVIRELSVKYIRPLKLGDEFIVETHVTKYGAASVSFEQRFIKNDTTYTILNGTAAYIGGDFRPKRIPDSWYEILGINPIK